MMEYFWTIFSILALLGVVLWVFILCCALGMADRVDKARQFLLDRMKKKHYNKREGL